MIRNFFTTAFRFLLREKANTIINISGLTLGITGSIVLFLIVKHGTSYDNYHAKRDRIYRLVSKSKGNNGYTYTQGIPPALPEAFRNDFTDVEAVAFTSYHRGSLITVPQPNGEVRKYEEPKGVGFAEPAFFTLFDRKIVSGSVEGLAQPNQAIISEKFALKYFASTDVLGKSIEYNHIAYTIAAVMEDYPVNTDLPFDLMFSNSTIKRELDQRGWNDISDNDNCYFLLKEKASIERITSGMLPFVKKYLGDGDKEVDKTFLTQPLSEIHSDLRFGNYNTKMPKEAYIAFSIIAVFLLLTACINFINLATAEAIKRTKQVGIRKILGSSRWQLINQFLTESLLITIIAVAFSLLASGLLLGFINPMMDLSLSLNLFSDFGIWIYLISVTLFISLIAGLYPAFTISKSQPVLALKNQISGNRSSGNALRKGLVVLQFFISQFFIIGTIVFLQQQNFMQQQDLGFNSQAIITLPIPNLGEQKESGSSNVRSFKHELMTLQGVEQASLCYAPPSFKAVMSSNFSLAGKEEEFDTQIKQVDGDYLTLYGIKLAAGEQLADADTLNGVVVNEKLARLVGLSNEGIIGRELSLWGKQVPVKGVVKDFNTTSLSRPIEPVVLLNNVSGYQSISVKLNSRNIPATLKLVQSKWEAAYPEYIYSYEFVDEQVRQLYRGERRLTALLNIFSFTAIFIGCLGLYGLVAFMTNQKAKEVGVRKVLGASVESIVFLFSKEFIKLILISFALAAPIAGFIMNKLLQEFAYKIELGPVIFLTGLGLTFLIAFVTVGFRSFKAATVNPVKSLRSE